MAIKIENYEWFEYAGRKVSFHTASAEHDLHLSKGEIFGYRKWGSKHFIVDKSELGIRFEFAEDDVKKLIKSSYGWSGKIEGVTAKAGIGGKVRDIPEPVPVTKPVRQPRTPKPEPEPVPVTKPVRQPRTPKPAPEPDQIVPFKLTKSQFEHWMDNEQGFYNSAPESLRDRTVGGIILRSSIRNEDELLDALQSIYGIIYKEQRYKSSREIYSGILSIFKDIAKNYKFKNKEKQGLVERTIKSISEILKQNENGPGPTQIKLTHDHVNMWLAALSKNAKHDTSVGSVWSILGRRSVEGGDEVKKLINSFLKEFPNDAQSANSRSAIAKILLTLGDTYKWESGSDKFWYKDTRSTLVYAEDSKEPADSGLTSPTVTKESKPKPVKVNNLTPLQIEMLRKIAENEYSPTNGAEPTSYDQVGWVWADSVITTKEGRGVFTSLNKLGLVKHDMHDMQQRKFKVILTKEGFESYRGLMKSGHYTKPENNLRILNIDSSMLDGASYDKKTKILTVDFKNGSTWEYHDVSEKEAADMEAGEGFGGSQGKYFIAMIRDVKMQNPEGVSIPRAPIKPKNSEDHVVQFRTTKDEFDAWIKLEQVNHKLSPDIAKPNTVYSIIIRSRIQNEFELVRVLSSLCDVFADQKKRPINKEIFVGIAEKMIGIAEKYPFKTPAVKKRAKTSIMMLKKFI